MTLRVQASDSPRAQAAIGGMVSMGVWMYAVAEMEEAVASCGDGTTTAAMAWDRSVALYAGSLEGASGDAAAGNMLYRLAEDMCAAFGTCTEETTYSTTASSAVNQNIFSHFWVGASQISAWTSPNSCSELEATKESIVAQMKVPLLQGMNRYAHAVSVGRATASEDDMARAHTFAAERTPLLETCDTHTAAAVASSLALFNATEIKEGKSLPRGFGHHLKAVERTYACLGVSCADVGCLVEDLATGECFASYPSCVRVTEVASNDYVDCAGVVGNTTYGACLDRNLESMTSTLEAKTLAVYDMLEGLGKRCGELGDLFEKRIPK